MPNINLPTGNTIYVSTYEYYFLLPEEEVDEFYQSCIADNLGVYIDNPFSHKQGRLEPEMAVEPDQFPEEETVEE